jgi:hypothetical protein
MENDRKFKDKQSKLKYKLKKKLEKDPCNQELINKLKFIKEWEEINKIGKTCKQKDEERGHKCCKICKENKELSNFYLKPNNSYLKTCKLCQKIKEKERDKKRREKNPKPKKLTQYEIDTKRGHKSCNKCKEIKNLTEFFLSKKKGHLLYGTYCKLCIYARNNKYKKKRAINNGKIKIKFAKQQCFKVKIKTPKKTIDQIDNERGWKLCNKCNKQKQLLEFSGGDKTKRKTACKECIREINKFHYQKNQQKNIEYAKKYRSNPENNKRILEKKKIYTAQNKERATAYRKNRRKTNINYHLRIKLGNRVRSAISQTGRRKNTLTTDLIGCSIKYFKEYIQSKFTPNMTWELLLQSKIHIDHIIPCAAFDLTKEDEQYKCFHYTNLQPLWATTAIAIEHGEPETYIGNVNKGDKIIPQDSVDPSNTYVHSESISCPLL